MRPSENKNDLSLRSAHAYVKNKTVKVGSTWARTLSAQLYGKNLQSRTRATWPTTWKSLVRHPTGGPSRSHTSG